MFRQLLAGAKSNEHDAGRAEVREHLNMRVVISKTGQRPQIEDDQVGRRCLRIRMLLFPCPFGPMLHDTPLLEQMEEPRRMFYPFYITTILQPSTDARGRAGNGEPARRGTGKGKTAARAVSTFRLCLPTGNVETALAAVLSSVAYPPVAYPPYRVIR